MPVLWQFHLSNWVVFVSSFGSLNVLQSDKHNLMRWMAVGVVFTCLGHGRGLNSFFFSTRVSSYIQM